MLGTFAAVLASLILHAAGKAGTPPFTFHGSSGRVVGGVQLASPAAPLAHWAYCDTSPCGPSGYTGYATVSYNLTLPADAENQSISLCIAAPTLRAELFELRITGSVHSELNGQVKNVADYRLATLRNISYADASASPSSYTCTSASPQFVFSISMGRDPLYDVRRLALSVYWRPYPAAASSSPAPLLPSPSPGGGGSSSTKKTPSRRTPPRRKSPRPRGGR
ncbi:hypothetical protein HYH02_003091 [Chlamydomonas schloesseri]|uniref:Pherophorin domain-containing protein n=1 Tax=Chlamydomonas schloesseri TaxID=2026947 RepID=A0A835WT19_9CHLO|nr:hypothetical protein HYH02_003091 [Chlamydomonas schloesseri]|eukprot:KAG2452055.1 hypothetical protein HYH02_003091 [Chlamydomonas schloesseri]